MKTGASLLSLIGEQPIDVWAAPMDCLLWIFYSNTIELTMHTSYLGLGLTVLIICRGYLSSSNRRMSSNFRVVIAGRGTRRHLLYSDES